MNARTFIGQARAHLYTEPMESTSIDDSLADEALLMRAMDSLLEDEAAEYTTINATNETRQLAAETRSERQRARPPAGSRATQGKNHRPRKPTFDDSGTPGYPKPWLSLTG